MISEIDLGDIQGNIVKAYGRYGFPVARHILYHVASAEVGRQFVADITPLITTSIRWPDLSQTPPVATNIAFTYEGLKRLDVPEDTLHSFPDEFSMGMKARRDIIGDTGPNHFSRWDPVWNSEPDGRTQHVHILVSINAKTEEDLERQYQKVEQILAQAIAKFPERAPGGVTRLDGHRGAGRDDLPYQPAAALVGQWDKEHFGYSDGISGTYFKGCGEDDSLVIGGGKPTGKDPRTPAGWAPIETGEFIFGHPDESCAYPEAPGPPLFSRNGTFLVYRKLHQNVASFHSYLESEGARFPGGKEALAAKFVGRWRNGAPLASFPTEESANQFVGEYAALKQKALANSATAQEQSRLKELNLQFVAFDYVDDLEGARCPFGAHTRRGNPRSALEFGQKGANGPAFDTPGALTNRRRMLRRGLPYGLVEEHPTDEGDHGVIILLLNADISRQFEFVQEQWYNFGNDFKLANDQDPILGNHGINENCQGEGRMVIEGDKTARTPPYFCGKMPTLVETRGGDYFFVPSMTCLRMIGLGIIDPT
jgi:deferrochelatase/peroxidase EfeB